MAKLDNILVSLKGKAEYEKLFEMAEVSNLTPIKINEYHQSLKIQQGNYSAIKTVKEEGLVEGEYKKTVEMALENILSLQQKR